MAKRLRPQQEKFFSFLTRKSSGEIVDESEILAATGWKPATIQAYRTKRHPDSFLTSLGNKQYRIAKDGSGITKGEVADAFTQNRPGVLVLAKGTQAQGRSDSYQLVRHIGRGAVAQVWVADSGNGNRYAVKILDPRPDLLEPSILRNVSQRFSRESRNGQHLKHPHVVRYRDVGQIERNPFLVMDLADESLASVLAKGKLDVQQAYKVVLQCAEGLQYLHGEGCVHRDVKPANILRMGDVFVLGDLGIVQWSDMNEAFTSAGTITRTSVQLGSWYYMAPEQRQSPQDVIPQSDVYALGISWYEMLTGRTPDPAAVGAQAMVDPCDDQRANDLIRRMINYTPSRRPKISEIVDALAWN